MNEVIKTEGNERSFMRSTMLTVVPVIGLLLLPLKAQSQGTLYVSNLGQTPTGSAAIGSDSWIAQQFVTGSNPDGYTLNTIQLLLNAASGNPSGFTVSVYSFNFNNGNSEPGGNLVTLSGSDPVAGGIFAYTDSGPVLSPYTSYFIVLTATTPLAQGAYDWSAVNGYTINNYWEIYPNYYSSADGSSWTGHPRGNVFQMAIYATAIPEPAMLALAGLGLATLSFLRRKR
jgi:hypothetical protein